MRQPSCDLSNRPNQKSRNRSSRGSDTRLPLRSQRFLFGSVAGACHHSHPNHNTHPDLCPTSAYHPHSQSRPLPWFYQSLCLRIHIYFLPPSSFSSSPSSFFPAEQSANYAKVNGGGQLSSTPVGPVCRKLTPLPTAIIVADARECNASRPGH